MTTPMQTSVSETIRKPPLAKAQTALGKQKHTAKDNFHFGGWNSSSLCNLNRSQ